MKLLCNICQHEIISSIIYKQVGDIDWNKAIQDVAGGLTKHIAFAHKEESARLLANMTMVQQYSVLVILLEQCALIPEEETSILGLLDTQRDLILRILGMEADEKIEKEQRVINQHPGAYGIDNQPA